MKKVFYVVIDKNLGFPLRFQCLKDCQNYLRTHNKSFFLVKEVVKIICFKGVNEK